MRHPATALLVVGLALVVGVAFPTPAGAQDDGGAGTDIGSQIFVQGATITGPCVRAKRDLNSPQAAAFVQSWLPNAFFGRPQVQDPPKTLRVCRVSVRYTVAGQRYGPMQVDYASDGKTAWISLPLQNLWPGVSVTVHRWTVALPTAVAAFEGKGTPVPVATAPPQTSTPSTNGLADPAPAGKSSSDGSDAAWIILALVVGVGLLGVTGYVVVRRRAVAAKGA